MNNSYSIALILLFLFSIWSCERPESPDFQIENKFEIPLTMEKTYPFLGVDEALVDTTSEEFINLFATDSDGPVRLVNEEEVFWGDLNDAIPDVAVPMIENIKLTIPPATGSQTVTENWSSTVDNNSFKFRDSNHFIEMNKGELTIDVTNSTDVSISLEITFPEIQTPSESSLVFTVDNLSPNESISNTLDLVEHRIYAGIDNEIDYEIKIKTTSSTQQGGDITTQIGFEDLSISKAEGYVVPKKILLNEDKTNDVEENIDVFNDDEAEQTELNGIDEISDRVSNIKFENPVLNMFYETNLGVQTTIYAVIVGTDNNGNTKFLKGINGSEHEVQDAEIPSELKVNGQTPDENQVIKFDLETAANPDPIKGESGHNIFDATNTNVSSFISNLPTNIRFVGIAKVNEKQENGKIVNPVIFNPSLGVEIPFSLSAKNATYKDTLNTDLSDLPEEDEDRKLSDATITINYSNGLPLDLRLDVIMLDAEEDTVTMKSDILVEGVPTNQDGYAMEPAQKEYEISFSESEMNDLYRTRVMVLDISFDTAQQKTVSIRGDDAVTFKVKVKTGITSTIN